MRSIHDNNIYSYKIKCEQQNIILHTEFLEGESPEYTDIIFVGVIGHQFDNVLEGNIILDIEESSPEQFYKEYKSDLQSYNLPLSVDSDHTFTNDISKSNVKIFIISSSYGLNGWVIATGMEIKGIKNKRV